MERFVKIKRKTAYLYLGLVFAAMALLMMITSFHSLKRGENHSILITGFGAGIMWAAAAFACIRTYYKANRTELPLFDEKFDSQNDKQ